MRYFKYIFWNCSAKVGMGGHHSSHRCEDCAYALHVSSCLDELCNNCEEQEELDKCDLESVASLAEACVPYKTIKQLFYTHSIGGCNKKNILDLELALCGLKCKASK
jgi:hypothetical protein